MKEYQLGKFRIGLYKGAHWAAYIWIGSFQIQIGTGWCRTGFFYERCKSYERNRFYLGYKRMCLVVGTAW